MKIKNIFEFASNDQSCVYLNAIFGNMSGVVCNPQGSTFSNFSLLGSMFKTFNSIILAIAALIVLYTTVVGVMQTAREGEFMGKKWDNMWIPIRMVFGIAFLVPTSTGYSVLQMIMMWVIVQGIGAADNVWRTAIQHIIAFNSPYTQINAPTIGAKQSVKELFQVLTCDATARVSKPNPVPYGSGGGYYCNQQSGAAFCRTEAKPDCGDKECSTSYGPSGACGKLTTCNSKGINGICAGNQADSLACIACKAQDTAMAQVFSALKPSAEAFVNVDYQYRDFYENSANMQRKPEWSWIYNYCSTAQGLSPEQCCVGSKNSALFPSKCMTKPEGIFFSPNDILSGGVIDPQGPSSAAVQSIYLPYGLPAIDPRKHGDFLRDTADQYTSTIQKAVLDWVTSQRNTNSMSDEFKDAINKGWIMAGSYYYTIAGMNNTDTQDSLPTFKVTPAAVDSTEMGRYRNNFSASQVLVRIVSEESTTSGGGGGGPNNPSSKSSRIALPTLLSALNGPLNDALSDMDSANKNAMNPAAGEDPISKLISMGNGMITGAAILFSVLVTITVIAGIAGYLSPFVLGTGVTNPAGGTFALIYGLIVPGLYALAGMMVTIGASLAIYVPLIPYIIFTMGAIGWMLSVVETMVASPLVALGIISPSGQHEIMGKAEPALMLLFNVFLRPTLMIFGLIAGMLMAKVVVTMIGAAFMSTVKAGVQPNGLIQIVLYSLAFMFVITTALNKCFSAIYLVPQQVFAWIGAQGMQYGEGEALAETKGKTEQAGAQAGAAFGGAEAGTAGATRQKGEQKAIADAEAQKKRDELGGG